MAQEGFHHRAEWDTELGSDTLGALFNFYQSDRKQCIVFVAITKVYTWYICVKRLFIHLIDDAVLLGLLGGHEEIALDIFFYFFQRLARHLGELLFKRSRVARMWRALISMSVA